MYIYQSHLNKLSGTSYSEIFSDSLLFFSGLKKRTKRRPYIRSSYFNKEKVFLDRFWAHLWDKNWRDRARRLKLLRCGIDLIEHSHFAPITIQSVDKKSVIFHRFCGMTKDKELFFVQIRQDKRSGQKTLMSIFPGD